MKKRILLILLTITITLGAYSQNNCIGGGIGGRTFIVYGDTLVLNGQAYDNDTENTTFTFTWGFTGKTETKTLNMQNGFFVYDTVLLKYHKDTMFEFSIHIEDINGCYTDAKMQTQFLKPDTTFMTINQGDSISWDRINIQMPTYKLPDFGDSVNVYYKEKGDYLKVTKIENGIGSSDDIYYAKVLSIEVIGNQTPTSINNITPQGFIYPNPVNGILNIDLESPNTKIYDSTGKLIISSLENNIETENLIKGIYSIIILSDGKYYQLNFIKN